MSDELKKKYARQKRLISGLYLTAAMLMLTLVLIAHNTWRVLVFVFIAIITAVIMCILQRCPGCKKRLPHDFDGTCPNCGEKIDDDPKSK